MNHLAPIKSDDEWRAREAAALYAHHRRMMGDHMDRLFALKAAGLAIDPHNREHLERLRDRFTALLGEGK